MTGIRESAWRDLIERAWDRAPVRYADAVTEPLVTSAEIMDALSGASSPLGPVLNLAPRSGAKEGVDCRLYIDGGELQDPAAFLAFGAAGRSVEEYGAILSQRLEGRRFGIVVNEFQKICPPLWRRLSCLLSELASAVGFSAAKSEAVLFAGDYSATPFGVHKDSAAVLQFSITGSKTMLFWAPGELPADYRSMTAADLERTALSLICGPRDVLAWPPEYHHVAKSDEPGFVVTLSVPVYLEFEPIKIILQSLQAAFSASAGSGRRARRLYGAGVAHALERSGALPEEFEIAWRHVETLIRSRAALGWLRADLRRRYGAFGLEPPPEEGRPPREVQKLLEFPVHVRDARPEPAGPFLARAPEESAVYVAGYSASAPGEPVSLEAELDGATLTLTGTVGRDDKTESRIVLDAGPANQDVLRRLASSTSSLVDRPRAHVPLDVVWASPHGIRRAPARDVGPEGMFVIDADPPPIGASLELGLVVEPAGETEPSYPTTVARVVYRDDAGFAVLYAPSREFAMALHEWLTVPLVSR